MKLKLWYRAALESLLMERIMAFLLYGYMELVHRTSSQRVINADAILRLRRANLPFLACFWHGRALMMPYLWPKEEALPFRVLVSPHRDGRLAARVMRHLHCDTVDGSDYHNPHKALREMITRLKRGECLGITPDGPRGPQQRAKPGVAAAARLAAVPVIPIAYSSSRHIRLRSWDRTMLPLPFGRSIYVVGDPIAGDGLSHEEFRQLIETRLTELCNQADQLARGGAPTEPTRGSAPTEPVRGGDLPDNK